MKKKQYIYGKVSREYIGSVVESYSKKKIYPNGKKWCNFCGKTHDFTKDIFGYNGYHKNGNRRLHSICLQARREKYKNSIS